jgi:peptidoglycan/xylan/chitin deacetylase (PgdA/CDA1 family)
MISRLLKLAIAFLFFIGHNIYKMICIQTGRLIPPSLVILTYHSVKESTTERFEKQMAMLLKTGRPVSIYDDISALPGGHNIAVTFDDAYQSILQNALPILYKNNIPATIFVPSGCIGKKPPWIIKPNHSYADETVLTESQLKALPADLITIGSHGVLHINLNNIDEKIARKEIFESKQTLEALLNTNINFFAAPYAIFDEKFTDLFRDAGYQRIFLNIPTFPVSRTDLYILGRIGVEPTDWTIEYLLKLSGAYQWLPLAINLKKKLPW